MRTHQRGTGDDLRERAMRGDCLCVCDARRGPDGRLEYGESCECERLAGVRDGVGGPKGTFEPCSPTTTRTDAAENDGVAAARARRDARARDAWRTDAVPAQPQAAGLSPERVMATLGTIDHVRRTVPILASTPNAVDGEALVSWDLSRFLKNPVILWAHNDRELPIGVAEDVKVDPDGLRMTVRFASAASNPLAEQVWNGVREGIVRAVSVSFERAQSTERDDGTIELAANVLFEVSFVPIGKDEDAGTPALTDPAAGQRNKRFFDPDALVDEDEDEDKHEPEERHDAIKAAAPAVTDRCAAARRLRDLRMQTAWKRGPR